jgi:putative spermidine/putrescine transport system ATP-binding protein
VAEVVYAGVATRFLVDLDAGTRLMVLQQNLRSSSTDVSSLRGTRTRLVWRREHEFELTEASGTRVRPMAVRTGTAQTEE